MKKSSHKVPQVVKWLMTGSVVLIGLFALHTTSCIQAKASSCLSPSHQTSIDESQALAPNYYHYSAANLKQAHQQHKKVVLYFWAPWCVTCTSLDLELQDKKAAIPEDVTVLRINYDQSSELKERYKVITQHTFVQVDENGQALSTWVGGEIDNFAKYLK